jgi:hypothetical protein
VVHGKFDHDATMHCVDATRTVETYGCLSGHFSLYSFCVFLQHARPEKQTLLAFDGSDKSGTLHSAVAAKYESKAGAHPVSLVVAETDTSDSLVFTLVAVTDRQTQACHCDC